MGKRWHKSVSGATADNTFENLFDVRYKRHSELGSEGHNLRTDEEAAELFFFTVLHPVSTYTDLQAKPTFPEEAKKVLPKLRVIFESLANFIQKECTAFVFQTLSARRILLTQIPMPLLQEHFKGYNRWSRSLI